jgi:hypothetical protein
VEGEAFALEFGGGKLGVRVHFISFFDTSGQAASCIVASSHRGAGNPEDHDADGKLSRCSDLRCCILVAGELSHLCWS